MSDLHACHVCGFRNAPYGLGPPLVAEPLWLCAEHWQREPSTQAMFAAQMAALVDTPDV